MRTRRLPDQADADELEAAEDEQHGRGEEGAIRDRLILDEPEKGEVPEDAGSDGEAPKPDGAEYVNGAASVGQQELHRHEIEDHPRGAAETVLRAPVLPLAVVHHDLLQLRARHAGQRRDEPVKLSVEPRFPG